MERLVRMIEQFHSRVSIDPMMTVMYAKDSQGFIEHAIRNLFNGFGKALQEKFGDAAKVRIQGCDYPELWAHPTNVLKYAEVAGRKVYGINQPPVELALDLWVMTADEYRGLLRRAEQGESLRAAEKAFKDGKHAERSRIKGRLNKLVEGVVGE